MKKILAIMMALMLLVGACALAEGETYKIGILQQLQHPALDLATQGFRDALTELLGDAVEFDEQNASNEPTLCATIANGFVSADVDLIMANATTALQSAVAATEDIPILGTSITHYGTALDMNDDWQGYTGINVSGTADLAPLDGQATMIQELFPDAETVGLLYCSAEPNSVYQIDTIQGYLEELGFTCNRYAFTDSNDIASVVTLACDEIDVLYIPTDNAAASNTETIRNVVEPAGIPVVAGEESICQGCGVATLTISYYDIGYKTGEMAYDVLVNGADISTMEIAFAPQFTKKYNAEMADIMGVTIPDDYEAIEEA